MAKGQSAFNKICFNNACLFLNNRGLAQPKDILLNIDTVQRQMCKYSRNAKTCTKKEEKEKNTLYINFCSPRKKKDLRNSLKCNKKIKQGRNNVTSVV